MKAQQNPFTHSYGNAGKAYIDMEWSKKVIDNFLFEEPSEFVYKIVGVRGSGKTVVLSDIIRYFRTPTLVEDGWLVYDLSSARDPLHTLVAFLAKEDFSHINRVTSNVHIGASMGILNAEMQRITQKEDLYYDDEAKLDILLNLAFEKKKKILVCVDDISKSEAMVAFCSVYAKYIRISSPFYFVCTGLFSNLNSLGNVRNLTFFKRSAYVEVGALSEVSITMKYKKFLAIDMPEARKLASLTKGYAYAYQVLGSLYFEKKDEESLEALMEDFDEELFRQSYEKIWEELTEGEHTLARILVDTKKRADILQKMEKPKNYSAYRSSLMKNGIIRERRRGEVEFTLPHFEEYVRYFT
ncbi:MAG: hypothetical protein IJ679_02970 [Lachnospiraceae bacterium]|nr:hypothetical protein [Lachnospiraceae bacterium]